MVYDICEILKGYLTGLPFTDIVAGLAVESTYKDKGLEKTLPYYCGFESGCDSDYTKLIPNKETKSILYFEEVIGASQVGRRANGQKTFSTSVNLIGWLNKKKLGETNCQISSTYMYSIMEALPEKRFDNGIFRNIRITSININPRLPQILKKYTYTDKNDFMLKSGYDYFSLRIDLQYDVNTACVIEPNNPEIEC